MKITHFTDTFYPKTDGIVTSILNFSRELIKNGHKITVFSPRYKKKKELRIRNMRIHRFLSFSLTSYKDVKITIPNVIRILREVRKEKPDIIHIHTPGPMGYMGIICSKLFRIPSVGTYHTLLSQQAVYMSPKKILKIEKITAKIIESRFISFIKNVRVIKKIKDSFIISDDINVERIGKKIIWKLTCRFYNRCNLVIVPSGSIKKLLKKKGIRKKIKVVSNGINIKLFKKKKKYHKKIKSIIHVGRISFEKNVDRTINAFCLISKKNPSLIYYVLGEGPAIDSLKRLAKKSGLTRKIKFLGNIDHKKLPGYYKKADFFVTASTMETQGLVILEAMASGLPVVGVRAFAIPDIIKNGLNGFMVKPDDIKGMANYMDVLIKNPRLVELLGKKAAASAKKHDLKKTTKLLEQTYVGLIKKKKK